MKKVTNKFGIELKIGDRLQIVSDKLGNKMLANVDKDEVIRFSITVVQLFLVQFVVVRIHEWELN